MFLVRIFSSHHLHNLIILAGDGICRIIDKYESNKPDA